MERVLSVMRSLEIIDFDGNLITRGKVYSKDKTVFVISMIKKCNASEKGDRSMSIVTEFTPLLSGMRERIHESNRFDSKRASKIIRCTNVLRHDYVEGKKLGGRWEKKEVNEKLIKLSVVFDPPLRAGEFVKYGFYTWDERYYPLTMDELRKRYNREQTIEGVIISQPTYYVKIEADLPWTPRNAMARKVLVITESGPHETEEIEGEKNFVPYKNKIVLELWKPEYRPYVIIWQPPV